MTNRNPENLYSDASFKASLFRLGGRMALTDYEPDCYIHSRKMITSTEGNMYPFHTYSICKAFINVGAQLKGRFGEFDSVLCEGAGAVLMTKVIVKLIDQTKSDQTKTPIHYLATGPESLAYAAIEKYLSKKQAKLGQVLVCSEFVESGQSLTRLTSILDQLGITYEVAVLESDFTRRGLSQIVRGKVILGMWHGSKIRPATDYLHKNPEQSGYVRLKNRQTPLLVKIDGGWAEKTTQKELETFTNKLARALEI